MKRSLFLLALLPASLQAQTEQPVVSAIRHVTVFLQGAQVTSAGQTTLDAGPHTLVFAGLPAGLDKNSLTVTGKGELTILAVQHRIDYARNQPKSPALLRLEDSLAYYRDENAALEAQKDALENERKMLLENQKIGGQQTGVPVERLREMADFFRSRLTDIGNRLLALTTRLARNNQRINGLNSQLGELTNRLSQPSGAVVVSVQARQRTTADLEISYLVSNAGWQPIYDLRAKDTKSPVQLSYKANVFQNTGNDWKDVRLTLSTGNPAQGGNRPVMNPQYVSVYQPRNSNYQNKSLAAPATNIRQQNRNLGNADEMIEREEVAAEPDAESVANYTVVNDGAVAATFDIALPYSVPSTGKPQLVDIQQHSLPAGYRHTALPKLDPDAFLLARVTGWENLNLLPGPVNVYFEGTFVGESAINPANTGDTLNLSLGRDKKVVVTRRQVTEYSARRTMGSNIRQTAGYRIAVRNTKKEPIDITIDDQFPISQDSRIEVELLEAAGAEINKETGRLSWKIRLNPAESRELNFKYEAKYPKDLPVSGL